MEKIPKATHPIPSNTCDFLPISTIRNNLTVDFSFLESLVICDKIATYFIIISTKDFQKNFYGPQHYPKHQMTTKESDSVRINGSSRGLHGQQKMTFHQRIFGTFPPPCLQSDETRRGERRNGGGRPGYSLITQPPSLNNSETEFVCWQIETQIGLMTIGSVIFSYTSLPESE